MFATLLVVLMLAHPSPPMPQADCKSAFGKTACGFGCVAAYGLVKCAETPEGRCQAAYGEITCWDPPLVRRPRPYRGDRAPRPQGTCQTAYGKTVCGFDCASAYGELKCAQTPEGVCHSAYGQLVCWDPPRPVRRGIKARCQSAYGQIACGYGCVTAYGKVRCANSPSGTCQAAYGDIVCSE